MIVVSFFFAHAVDLPRNYEHRRRNWKPPLAPRDPSLFWTHQYPSLSLVCQVMSYWGFSQKGESSFFFFSLHVFFSCSPELRLDIIGVIAKN